MDFTATLKFLKDLSKHNDREWFEKNKPRYQETKAEFEVFVGELLEQLQSFDGSLAGLNPKKLTFRIYRDVRFSKDKRPYKTNYGAAFSHAGKGMGKPGYYLHIEPGNKSFIAGGLFQPEPAVVASVRQEIDYNGDALKKIFANKKFKATFNDFWDEDKLKTAPKGFEKDHPYIEWLKLKSFIVTHNLTDKDILDKKFQKKIVELFKHVKPLNDFLTTAMD